MLHFRTCNLCEAMCGLKIEHDGHQILKIEGDEADEFSQGHICPKALALKDIFEDPDRLKKPLKRTSTGWEMISWDQAFTETIAGIKAVQAKYGSNAVAMYQGNPSIHNLGTMMFSPAFAKALKTKNHYTATSTDQLPHHFASQFMFGHPMLLPVPDIDNTDFMLIMGGNPLASNGSMMTAPNIAERLRNIQKHGGKVVVVDPRRTETAHKANQWLGILPGTDAFLLLSMLHVVFRDNLNKDSHLTNYLKNVDLLQELVQAYSPSVASKQTGIAADTIVELTHAFCEANSAVAYGRVGLSTQAFGGLCQWLVVALNAVTGNLDSRGGAMFSQPAVDFITGAKFQERYNRWQSRVRGLPEFLGELPVATLAEEILTPGEGQIKALITSCGNPVLSTPNGQQLDKGLENLEFMVSIDIFLNETTRHANIILPPATGLEVGHYDLTFHALAVRNTAKYSAPMYNKNDDAKYDWEIFQTLVHLLTENPAPLQLVTPEAKLDLGLQMGIHGLNLEKLKEAPHGIDLGPLQPCLLQRIKTPDGCIDLAPTVLVNDLARLSKTTSQHGRFALIGRRHLRDNNSWLHNSPVLMKGKNRCTLLMHPNDAKELNVVNGQIVSVKSRVATLQVPIQFSEDLTQGVVSLPHGYGHGRGGIQMQIAQQHAGVSVNDLTDELLVDELTGNADFSGLRVDIF